MMEGCTSALCGLLVLLCMAFRTKRTHRICNLSCHFVDPGVVRHLHCSSANPLQTKVNWCTPPTPDFYFSDVNAADFRSSSGANLTTSSDGVTYSPGYTLGDLVLGYKVIF